MIVGFNKALGGENGSSRVSFFDVEKYIVVRKIVRTHKPQSDVV